jgi:hypothetical protein
VDDVKAVRKQMDADCGGGCIRPKGTKKLAAMIAAADDREFALGH